LVLINKQYLKYNPVRLLSGAGGTCIEQCLCNLDSSLH